MYVYAIVGGTVVENQLVQNGNFADGTTGWRPYNANNASISVSNNVLTATFLTEAASGSYQYGAATEVKKLVAGHKYLVETDIYVTNAGNYAIDVNGSTSGRVKNITSVNTWVNMCFVCNAVESPATSFLVEPYQKNIAVGDTMSIRNTMLIDLTQMFGTTIADYLYSLETATSGAGIAKLREWGFDLDTYHEYNPGTLESVSGVSAHETVGFNQWDEEYEVGGLSTTDGQPSANNNSIRSKNFIPCLPDTVYYTRTVNPACYLWFYDSDKNFISFVTNNVNNSVTTPSNCHYMKLRAGDLSNPLQTYNHDICINLSNPSRNGEYEPYEHHNYPIDSSLTLRGVPKLVDGELQYDGDRYLPDGTVERRYGIVDLGTLNWQTHLSGTSIFSTAGLINNKATTSGAICALYTLSDQAFADIPNMCMRGTKSNPQMWAIRDDRYTTLNEFKAAMSGVMLVYELAESTTETAQPYRSYQECDPDGTEEYVTTSIVPVGHETRHPENLRAKIEGLPWDFSSLIAPTEKTATASRNYTAGSLLIMNNTLYKVTANIANGGTITPNTNVTATTLSEIISALAQ